MKTTIKKTLLLAVLVLAVGGARLESGIVAAGDGARGETELERIIVRFRADYDNLIGGHFSCVGFRVSNKSLTRDTEECIFTDLTSLPPGTYLGNPAYIVNGTRYLWNSDYDGQQATHVRVIVTDSGDGTGHVDLEAFY